MISKENIQNAHNRIKPYIHKTPVFTSSYFNENTNSQLFFKAENLQKAGAFKVRGAFNFGLQIPESELSNGLCTHSSGNHAQAVALAAKVLKTKAYIVMPENAPKMKIEAVKNYGAEITYCKPTLEAREDKLNKIQKKSKAVFIPPYDHENIIAGQATCALELLDEISDLDIIICPVGGGGLLAGTTLSANYFGENVVVYGAEPLGADDAKRSLDAGKIIPSVNPWTIADGLLTSLGESNFKIIKNGVKDIICVEEIETEYAMQLVAERMKLLVEPSAAVTVAAILKHKPLFENKKIGVILSGGNIKHSVTELRQLIIMNKKLEFLARQSLKM